MPQNKASVSYSGRAPGAECVRSGGVSLLWEETLGFGSGIMIGKITDRPQLVGGGG